MADLTTVSAVKAYLAITTSNQDALISALFRLRGLAGRLQPLTELLTIARAERRLRVSE